MNPSGWPRRCGATVTQLTQHYVGDYPTLSSAEETPGRNGNWVIGFLIFQFVLQVLLLVPGAEFLRMFDRIGSLTASIILTLALSGRILYRYPFTTVATLIMAWAALEMAHPDTNLISGVAEWAYLFSVISLFFWMPRVRITPKHFYQLIGCYWSYHALSSFMGFLQVRYPGHFIGNVTTLLAGKSNWQEALSVKMADGTSVLRPFGLTDVPGGAAYSGMIATIFGMATFLGARRFSIKCVSLVGVALGLFCIFFCQVRVAVVMTLISGVVLLVLLVRKRDMKQAARLGIIGFAMSFAVLTYALTVGGDAIATRLGSLVESNAADVYTQNHGAFLLETFTELIPQFPLGAGMGRWGPMNGYFASYSPNASEALWAEITIQGWLYDGGVFFIILWYILTIGTILTSYRVMRALGNHPLSFWAAVVCANDVGLFAGSFNHNAFIGNAGIEFFLMNIALYGAYLNVPRKEIAATPLPITPTDLERYPEYA
jgi:hypothetical protein